MLSLSPGCARRPRAGGGGVREGGGILLHGQNQRKPGALRDDAGLRGHDRGRGIRGRHGVLLLLFPHRGGPADRPGRADDGPADHVQLQLPAGLSGDGGGGGRSALRGLYPVGGPGRLGHLHDPGRGPGQGAGPGSLLEEKEDVVPAQGPFSRVRHPGGQPALRLPGLRPDQRGAGPL